MDTPVPPPTSALVVYRPLVERLIAALGALVTHQVAYTAAAGLPRFGIEVPAAVDHGHLSAQWVIVAPLAVAAIAAFIVWQLRNLGFRTTLSGRRLGGLVAGFFIVQEIVEGLLASRSVWSVLTHPARTAGW
ncbi:MAG: hypothetical protein AAF547_24295, partial [Actinomycetota bacterium]